MLGLCDAYKRGISIDLSGSYGPWEEMWVVKCHARLDEFLAWEPHIWQGQITKGEDSVEEQMGVQIEDWIE